MNFNKINKSVDKINNELINENCTEKINQLVRKREELLSGYIQIDKLPYTNMSLPLKEKYGGTGLTSNIFPVHYGGTGLNNIPNNGILIGDEDKLNIKIINGEIIDTLSPQIIYNKMFDEINLINLDLEKSIKNILPISKGGTGQSSLLHNTIVGYSNVKLYDNVFFSVRKNTVQIINNNDSIINNWHKLNDTSNSFNLNTGIFTVPVSGNYIFTWSICFESENNNYGYIKCVTSKKTFEVTDLLTENNNISGSANIRLDKGDFVYLIGKVDNNNAIISDKNDVNWFTGFLLSVAYRI